MLRIKAADTDTYMEMRADAELTGRRLRRTDGNWNETGIMVAAGSGPKTTMPTHNDVNDDLRSDGSAVNRSTDSRWATEPETTQRLQEAWHIGLVNLFL